MLKPKLLGILLLYLTGPTILCAALWHNGCPDHQFECTNGKCIPLKWVCDRQNDCLDESDEAHCEAHTTCASDQFQCNSTDGVLGRCIPNTWVCDGEFDCENKEDELECDDVKCGDDTFVCPMPNAENGTVGQTCIPNNWRCDGMPDCGDESDEQDCHAERSCKPGDFRCEDGRCIEASWECDGEQDCYDNSDEKLCKYFQCSVEDPFFCVSTGDCIPRKWACDGDRDCDDASDEMNCGNRTDTSLHCNSSEFACKNGRQCIRSKWVCDGDVDCSDRSDETDCNLRKCNADEKKCDIHRCLSKNLWCNGVEDCVDGTDEIGCPAVEAELVCDDTHYQCPGPNRTCIHLTDLCQNPFADCPQTVCHQHIEKCKNGTSNCSCRTTRHGGTICYCNPGFELRDNRCIDINECLTPGICDQTCINLEGSYECRCHHGYHLMRTFRFPLNQAHPTKCRALGSEPLLLLAGRREIREFNLITRNYDIFTTQPMDSYAMDLFFEKNILVWANPAQANIMFCQLEKGRKECTNEEKVLVEGAGFVHSLAVDWVHDLIYWAQKEGDASIGRIIVFDMKSHRRATIFYDGVSEPQTIAVDPSEGLIFWSDANFGWIQRAGMTGKERKALYLYHGAHSAWPSAVTLDLMDKRVFWADSKLKHIASSDYHGNDIRIVFSSHRQIKHPFSLAVFEDRVYWSDKDHHRIQSTNKFTGKDVRLALTKPTVGNVILRIRHELVQPSYPNKCLNAGCDHICVPRSVLETNTTTNTTTHNNDAIAVPFACICAGYSIFSFDDCEVHWWNLEGSVVHISFLVRILALVVTLAIILLVVVFFAVRRLREHRLKLQPYGLLATVRYHRDSVGDVDNIGEL